MTALCATRPAEWWDTEDEGSRLAITLCGACPHRAQCADEDPAPHGVIRAGVPYSNTGRALPLCPTCGYPQPGEGLFEHDRCRHCEVPSLGRWRSDILRWHVEGVSDRQAGAWVGASREQIKAFRAGVGRRQPAKTTKHLQAA